MKEQFRSGLHLGKKNILKLNIVNAIIKEYLREGYRLTLRQLYYQLVSRDIIPNRVQEYAKLSTLLVKGRMAGVVDWEAIEDRIRIPFLPYWVLDIPDAIKADITSLENVGDVIAVDNLSIPENLEFIHEDVKELPVVTIQPFQKTVEDEKAEAEAEKGIDEEVEEGAEGEIGGAEGEEGAEGEAKDTEAPETEQKPAGSAQGENTPQADKNQEKPH